MSAVADNPNEIATVRIELEDSDPPIWREVEVQTSVTLKTLHAIVQAAMGWEDCHLWEFKIGNGRYGPPMKDDWGDQSQLDAGKVRLRDVLGPRKTKIDYMYDFGDSWQHRLTVTNVRPGDSNLSYPRYIAGERSAPPEDSGGLPGFYDKLEAASDPKHPDHKDIKEWLGDYDPDKIDEAALKAALGRIANRAKAANTSRTKTKPKSAG